MIMMHCSRSGMPGWNWTGGQIFSSEISGGRITLSDWKGQTLTQKEDMGYTTANQKKLTSIPFIGFEKNNMATTVTQNGEGEIAELKAS